MRIGIIGAGRVGLTLGRRWAEAGHEVTYGVRSMESPSANSIRGDNLRVTLIPEAVSRAEAVLLSVPSGAVKEVVQALGDLGDRVLIDCTNALGGIPDGKPTMAEAITDWSGSGKVVKAFNTTGSGNMGDPKYPGTNLDMFIAGDDPTAKSLVAILAHDVGFSVIDVGDLSKAVLLEYFAKLWIHLAFGQKMGANIGFKLLNRQPETNEQLID